jgi:hypothetical protein
MEEPRRSKGTMDAPVELGFFTCLFGEQD